MYLVHLTTLLVFPVHQNHSKVQKVLHQNSCRMLALYSTAQRKPNRESEREQVQNGYKNVNRTGTERIQHGYRMDTER